MDSTDIPSFALIDVCIENPEIREALKEVKAFQQQTINRLTGAHIQTLLDCGFNFVMPTITGRRQEIKQFVAQHPEVMSNDLETLLCNISHYGTVTDEMQRSYQERQERQLREKVLKQSRYSPPPKQTMTKTRRIKKVIYEDEEDQPELQ